ncbi:MAG: mechanosensitive ion channel [Chromatiaceae bacterium]|nr:mechanosensitive ion channel [Chromatiaceae bacterium]MCP5444473.1 mechanosensitive ion channel [Chromatiaceae bacterium]
MKHALNPDCRTLLLLGMLALLTPDFALAQQPTVGVQLGEALANREQLLKSEIAATENEAAELAARRLQFEERIAALSARPVDQTELEQVGLTVDTRRVAQESVELAIKSVQGTITELIAETQRLADELQVMAAVQRTTAEKPMIAETRARLTEKQELLKLEQRRMQQLEQRKQLARDRTQLAERWFEAIKEAYRNQQEQARKLTLDELEKQLIAEQQRLQEMATEYRTEVNRLRDDSSASQSARDVADTRLTEAEESLFLTGIRLKSARMLSQLDKIAEGVGEQSADLRKLKSASTELEGLKQQLQSLLGLIRSKSKLLQQRREVLLKGLELETSSRKEYRQVQSLFDDLIDRFGKRIEALETFGSALEERSEQVDMLYLDRKKRGLTERHQLPNTLPQWEILFSEMTRLPDKMVQIGRSIFLSLATAMQQADITRWLSLFLLSLLWSAGCLSLGKLKPPSPVPVEKSFTRRAILITTALIRGNRFGLLAGGLLLIAGWLLEIVAPGLAIIATLLGIWLGMRLTIGLSRLILDSPLGLADRQPGLFRLIVFHTILISLFALGLALGILDLVSQPMKEFLERCFMLLLLPPAYLALRIRNLWYGLLQERKGVTHWVRLAGVFGMVIPLTIAAAALLGLFGYINLAFSVGRYMTIFFAVIIGWMIARGVVMDLAGSVEMAIARRSQQSGFWVRSLVEPVQYMLRLGLFLTVLWVLYRIFLEDPATGIDLKAWLDHTLFTIGGNPIDSLDLLGSILLLFLVFYLGRWAREITYGWVYARIKDIGIRNSLSVFTQYAVVVIGLLIVLNVIGINLTSLAVFAGALGVGIGFGMQNIANNFISGLILLAERPVRTSDWVTIGDKEGAVAAIGMRSVTVTTWDNQDVIIPNSDLISNSFINWTRTDNEVRTVLIVGVSYHADPHLARQVILDAVTMQPRVSLTPKPPQVWLIDFAASSVNFRVQYFTDVVLYSRLEVQSSVLFAIWDALKEAGIGIPFPQQDVYIKEFPDSGKEQTG